MRHIILDICRNTFIRRIFGFVLGVTGPKRFLVRLKKIDLEDSFLSSLDELKVARGPFSSLVFPKFRYAKSDLAPKILGSYEMELTPLFEQLFAKEYKYILDIGSAEGYYAVGLAQKFSNSKVVAFDIDRNAIKHCKALAKYNRVSNIEFYYECVPETLANFDFGNELSLIMCDCEGYEKILFSPLNIQNIKNCDILIEVHDNLNPSIGSYLKNLFVETHQLQIIKSSHRENLNYPELGIYSDLEKKIILSESRGGILEYEVMEWYYFKPNK